jgi:hypothetical protein
VHKFGWILAHRFYGYLIMQPPIVRHILPKSMVANLRHQSIINMNGTNDSAIT